MTDLQFAGYVRIEKIENKFVKIFAFFTLLVTMWMAKVK